MKTRHFLAALMATSFAGCTVEGLALLDDLRDQLNNQVNGKAVVVNVGGMDYQVSLNLSPQPLIVVPEETAPPADYPGIGIDTGNAVVDGLKVRLTGIELDGGEDERHANVADWTNSPKEIEISKGFSGSVSAETVIPYGTYAGIQVRMAPGYSLKAWAYLDQNEDGEIDFTAWTTSSGVTWQSEKLLPEELTGYDYYDYGFMYWTTADGVESTRPEGEGTWFAYPIEVTSADTITNALGAEVPNPDTLQVDIRIDTLHLAKVWNGQGQRDDLFGGFADHTNDHGVTAGELFPDGAADFAIGYLPLFTLVNEPQAVAETYEVSDGDDFAFGWTQLATIVFNGDGEPVIGRVRDRGGLDLNQFMALFTSEGDTYTFQIGDGDLLYNNDVAQAQHQVAGFQRLAVDDAPVQITVSDGAQCSQAAMQCQGDRTGFIRRIARDN